MSDKGKPLAVIAIGGKPKGKPDGDEPSGDSEDSDSGEMAAAEDAVSAAKAGDADGFASAMKDFVRICIANEKRGGYEKD